MKLKAMKAMMTLRLLLSDWLRRTLGVASLEPCKDKGDKSPCNKLAVCTSTGKYGVIDLGLYCAAELWPALTAPTHEGRPG